MGWVGRHEYRCMPGCRGEASGNGITGEPAHLMPDASPLQNTGIDSAQNASVGAQGQVYAWVDLALSAHRPAPTKTEDCGWRAVGVGLVPTRRRDGR